MEQAQPQRGLDEQAPDRFKVIPEEIEGQWRHPPAGETDQQDDEGHGHGKKSMLTKMKDKAKTLRTKVKKSMKPSHGASQEESPGESQEGSHETSSEEEEEDVEEQHQTDEKTDDVTKTLAGLDSFGTRHVLGDDNKSSVQHITAEKDPLMSSNKEEMITEETMKPKIGEVTTEATRSSLGLGKVQQIQDQGEEEKPMSTKLGESITDVDVDDGGRGEYKFAEDHFQTNPENPAPGKAWNQRSSEDADRGKENLEEFGVHNGTSSPENPGEEQPLSPGGKVSDNVKETPEKSELGKPWNERASEGLGFAKEKLQGYGVYKGIKSSEKPEESQSSVGNAQDKVSEIGEGKEMGSDKKSPNYTEEFKTGPSETDPGYVREASILGKEMGSDKKFPNYTEENKTGPSETDPGYVREASILAEELKTGLSFDQTSSNNEAKDTVIEGECKENEDGGTQQQQSEGEGKPGQSYASKIFSAKNAISSKLGYGGQINQDQTSSNNKAKDTVIEGERKENEDEGTQQQQREGEGKPGQSYVSKIYSAKDAISSKLGYGGQINQDQTSSNNKAKDTVIEGERKENEDEGTQQQQSEGEGKAGQSYASKIYSAKDAISSKLGYGGQTNQEPNVMGESKPADPIQGTATESMEGTKESKETFKSTIVSKLSPGEDHKALSEVITEAVSNSAKTLKDSLGGLYGGGGKVSTTDPNIGASESNNQSTPSNPPGGKGIVDRVTGVVGSFLGRKQEDNSEQHSSSGKPEPKSQVQVEEQVPDIPKF